MPSFEDIFAGDLRSLGLEAADGLAGLPGAAPEVQREVLKYVGGQMFSCSHQIRVEVAWEEAKKIDPAWLRQHLDWLMDPYLELNDYWEYIAIGYFLSGFDREAHQAFLERCRTHDNPEVRGIYADWLAKENV